MYILPCCKLGMHLSVHTECTFMCIYICENSVFTSFMSFSGHNAQIVNCLIYWKHSEDHSSITKIWLWHVFNLIVSLTYNTMVKIIWLFFIMLLLDVLRNIFRKELFKEFFKSWLPVRIRWWVTRHFVLCCSK